RRSSQGSSPGSNPPAGCGPCPPTWLPRAGWTASSWPGCGAGRDHQASDPAMSVRPVRRALLSVSDKTGLVELARALAAGGTALISTGGTARSLREAGLEVLDVSALTGFPEILDGRVKTLHPRVHGGLLARRDHPLHAATLAEHDIAPIDLLVVNLYPFEDALRRGLDFEAQLEEIDVGGPAMIRAAAKNHDGV